MKAMAFMADGAHVLKGLHSQTRMLPQKVKISCRNDIEVLHLKDEVIETTRLQAGAHEWFERWSDATNPSQSTLQTCS